MSIYRGPSVIGTSNDTTHEMVRAATEAAISAANFASQAEAAATVATAKAAALIGPAVTEAAAVAVAAATSTIVVLEESTVEAASRAEAAAALAQTSGSAVALKNNLALSGGAGLVGANTYQTQQQVNAEWKSVKAFGAKGDGVTDDTVAIQAALNLGGRLYFPKGTFVISNGLNVVVEGTSVVGAGRNSTVIKQTVANKAVFNTATAYTEYQSFTIEYATQGIEGGNGFNCSTFYNTWKDIKVLKAHIAWDFGQYSNSNMLLNILAYNYTNIGVHIHDEAANVLVTNFFFVCDNTTTYGLLGAIRLFNQAEGNVFTNGQIYQGAYTLTTGADLFSISKRPAYNKFIGVYFDSAQFGTLVDRVVEFDFTNCWFSNRPSSGVYINQVDGVRFSGGGSVNNAAHGAIIEAAARKVVFNGFSVSGNGTLAANIYSGLKFAPGCSEFVVTNCTIGDTLGFGTQQYGIHISGASDNFNVSNNYLIGNATKNLLDTSTGTNKIISGNVGYSNSKKGVLAITVGLTNITVPHLLDVTPGQADIVCMPTSDVAATNITRWWVSAVTATTFTLNVNDVVAGTQYFTWTARTAGAV